MRELGSECAIFQSGFKPQTNSVPSAYSQADIILELPFSMQILFHNPVTMGYRRIPREPSSVWYHILLQFHQRLPFMNLQSHFVQKAILTSSNYLNPGPHGGLAFGLHPKSQDGTSSSPQNHCIRSYTVWILVVWPH